MKTTLLLIAATAVTGLSACKSKADQKMPEMAKDVCNCLSMLEKNMSVEARNVFMSVNNVKGEDNIQDAFKKALQAVPAEKQMDVGLEMQKIGGEMESETSEVGACMKRMEAKYKNIKTMDSDREVQRKMAKALKEQNCNFAAAVMQIASNR